MLTIEDWLDLTKDIDVEVTARTATSLPKSPGFNPFDPQAWAHRMRLIGGPVTGRAYHHTPHLVSRSAEQRQLDAVEIVRRLIS